jgi:hypothetical protein
MSTARAAALGPLTNLRPMSATKQMVTKSAIKEREVGAFASDAIDRCGGCGSAVALQAPTSNCPASSWLCRRCGSVYFARGQEKDGKEFGGGARLVSYYEVMKAIYVHMDGETCPILRKDVQRMVKGAASRKYLGREGRKQKRYPAAAQVTVVPLGPDFRVAGPPARIMTFNVSAGGAALFHSRRVIEPYLAVDFAASGIELLPAILQVTRVRTLPTAYEIAGKFVSRILH